MKFRSKNPDCTLRLLTAEDAEQALVLYNELTVGPPARDPSDFARIINHEGTSVIGAFVRDQLAAMVTLHMLPNILWGGRPYALIENVVTRSHDQGQGFGRAAMEAAAEMAWAAQAYKIMLMTGRKRGAKGFYEALGYSDEDKFAMVQRAP